MNHFEMEMLLKSAFHYMDQDTRRKVMNTVPLIYNKYIGSTVMQVKNITSDKIAPVTLI